MGQLKIRINKMQFTAIFLYRRYFRGCPVATYHARQNVFLTDLQNIISFKICFTQPIFVIHPFTANN